MREKINVEKHSLVPEHILLSVDEAKNVLDTYNIISIQLPRILIKDVAIKKLGPKVGDIIKIIRNSDTGKKIVYYRLVVSE